MLKMEREFNARNDERDNPLEGSSTQYPESIHKLEEASMNNYGSIYYDQYRTEVKRSQFVGIWGKFTKWMRHIYSDCVLTVIVVGFGLTATFTSTYYSMPSLKQIVLGGSCINNLTRQLEL